MINLFRPLFLVFTRPHRVSCLTFLICSLNLLHKVTYIFWALTCRVVLPSYTALILSFCSSSHDFDTHFLHFHLAMDSLCFSMWLAISTSTTDLHQLAKQHACRTRKKPILAYTSTGLHFLHILTVSLFLLYNLYKILRACVCVCVQSYHIYTPFSLHIYILLFPVYTKIIYFFTKFFNIF